MVSTQTSGVILLAVAGALVWSAWALVVAGVLLLTVPEVLALHRRRRLLKAAREGFAAADPRRGLT